MAGFTFEPKPSVEIDGERYACDPTDSALIAGVVENFPRILMLGNEFAELDAKLKAALATSPEESNGLLKEIQHKNDELLCACRDFIQGCVGADEYAEIFAARRPNSVEHLKLCVYLYGHIMGQREAVVSEYLDMPEESNAADNATENNPGPPHRNRISKVASLWGRMGRAADGHGKV